jgi:adenylate kinase
MVKLIFVGPQGCGKGTQAKVVAEKMDLCHISTGDLLREVQGELKAEVDSFMSEGKLVSDDLIVRILSERIMKEDCDNGFILDGFPRNVAQADELDKIMDVDKVIEIAISDDESVARIGGRRNCLECGAIWNVNTSPKPKEESKCDKCGEELTQRADDNEEALRKRLAVYHNDTEPILEKYESVKIDGEQSIEKVSEDLLKELE